MQYEAQSSRNRQIVTEHRQDRHTTTGIVRQYHALSVSSKQNQHTKASSAQVRTNFMYNTVQYSTRLCTYGLLFNIPFMNSGR